MRTLARAVAAILTVVGTLGISASLLISLGYILSFFRLREGDNALVVLIFLILVFLGSFVTTAFGWYRLGGDYDQR